MPRLAKNRWIAFLLIPTLIGAGGCGLATDLFNPDFFNALGFDAATIVPPEGKVIVAFQNNTVQTANFAAAYAETAASPSELVFGLGMEGGEVRQMVIDCPVAFLAPGGFGDDGQVAAVVEVGAEGAQIAFTGQALASGVDFTCGDVILIELVQVGGAGDEAAFQLQVSVIPS